MDLSTIADAVWRYLTFFAEINPLLIVFVSAVIFGVITFARSNASEVLRAMLLIYSATILFMGPGQAVTAQVRTLPRIQDKAICVGAATYSLAMWKAGELKQVKKCSYRDHSLKITAPGADGKKQLDKVRDTAVSNYGLL